MAATLESRFPEIIAELRPKVSAAVKVSAETIAEDAGAAAPVGPTGELGQSIEARNEGVAEYGIYAAWYWFFPEFGTAHSAPEPYMLPAVEANKLPFEAEVTAVLRGL